ncbi:MAG TPA: hypothetical protein VJG49_03455, partial [Candidatus Nanoarchaeia archaeon]|nr:hypothetical protein [Candidatus Nanoarchaeia archaeon]
IFPPVYFTGGLVDCQPSIGKIMVRKPTRAVGEHATGLLTGGGRFSLTMKKRILSNLQRRG